MTDRRLEELETLYRARFPVFLRAASAITRDDERAYDAVQDGFAAAIRERRRFRGEGPLEAWVWRMVMNAALKSFRAEPPREFAPSVNGAVPTADPELRHASPICPNASARFCSFAISPTSTTARSATYSASVRARSARP